MSIRNTKYVHKIKRSFLRSKVDEIWHEDRYYSGKVYAHFFNFSNDNFNKGN